MKKIILTISTFVLMIACALTISVFSDAKVRISNKKLTLNVSEKYSLKLDGTKRKATWKSSKPKVAKVNSKGRVTALKKGKTTVTAKAGKKKFTCVVLVDEKEKNNKTGSDNAVNVKNENADLPLITKTDAENNDSKKDVKDVGNTDVFDKTPLSADAWLYFAVDQDVITTTTSSISGTVQFPNYESKIIVKVNDKVIAEKQLNAGDETFIIETDPSEFKNGGRVIIYRVYTGPKKSNLGIWDTSKEFIIRDNESDPIQTKAPEPSPVPDDGNNSGGICYPCVQSLDVHTGLYVKDFSDEKIIIANKAGETCYTYDISEVRLVVLNGTASTYGINGKTISCSDILVGDNVDVVFEYWEGDPSGQRYLHGLIVHRITNNNADKYNISAPVYDAEQDYAEWDCIYFGSYPQDTADVNVKEPVKWRVLSIDDNKNALIITDKCLCHSGFNGTIQLVNYAFTKEEYAQITWKGIKLADICNPAYGFCPDSSKPSATRKAETTYFVNNYSAEKYDWSSSYAQAYFLAETVEGQYENRTMGVNIETGGIYKQGFRPLTYINDQPGKPFVVYMNRRMAMVNLNEVDTWTYAGKVTSE